MRLSEYKLKKICREQGFGLTEVLEKANVSRTAYYSLIRKDSIIPKSVLSVAEFLDIPVSELLHDEELELRKYNQVLNLVNEIAKKNKISEKDNIRHTLLSLEKTPLERLRTALRYV